MYTFVKQSNKQSGNDDLLDQHTHPLCDRSEILECKAELRCRSLHQSSASESSHTALVFQLIYQLDAANDKEGECQSNQ